MKQVGFHTVSLVGSEVLYRGEGNANLVVALPDRRIVLRFPKSKFADKSQEEKLQCIARYVNTVMIAELGENYVKPVNIGVVSYQDFEDIKKAVKFVRPGQRCYKDIFFPKALILPDLTLPSLDMETWTKGSVLSIELKPKQGYYFGRNCVHDTLCNFCLKQWHKLKTGRIVSRSDYCPLDLYSGNCTEMSKALGALMRSPQNNLRIFCNGQLQHGEDRVAENCRQVLDQFFGCDGERALTDVLVSTLMSDTQAENSQVEIGKSSQYIAANPGKPKDCSSKKSLVLPKKCILSAVLSLQKKTAITDKEAQDILNELLKTTDDITELQKLITMPQNKDQHQTSSHIDKINLLRNYMLAVTAKDLSMILTIREAKSVLNCDYRDMLRVNDKLFCYSWSIVDLDPKQLQRISKYVYQKQLWLDAYNKHQMNGL